MEISDFREFADLAETLSFSATAERMFISQSALSKHIARMERELGITLFDRSRQGVMLTPGGKRVQDHAKYILRRYDALLGDVRAGTDQMKGILRVGFLDAAVRDLLRTGIRAFGQRFPGIQIQPMSRELGDLERDLEAGRVDLAITIKFSNSDWPKDCRFVELYADGIAAVVAEDSPLAKHSFLSFEELIEYPFLMPSEQQYPNLGRLLAAIAKSRGTHLDVAYEFSHISSASMMVESGNYVTAMPLHISKLFEGSRFINLTDPEALIQIGAKWRANSQAPGIEQFVGTLLDCMGMPQSN